MFQFVLIKMQNGWRNRGLKPRSPNQNCKFGDKFETMGQNDAIFCTDQQSISSCFGVNRREPVRVKGMALSETPSKSVDLSYVSIKIGRWLTTSSVRFYFSIFLGWLPWLPETINPGHKSHRCSTDSTVQVFNKCLTSPESHSWAAAAKRLALLGMFELL